MYMTIEVGRVVYEYTEVPDNTDTCNGIAHEIELIGCFSVSNPHNSTFVCDILRFHVQDQSANLSRQCCSLASETVDAHRPPSPARTAIPPSAMRNVHLGMNGTVRNVPLPLSVWYRRKSGNKNTPYYAKQ